MWDGKKTIAQNVFYNALDEIKKRIPDAEPIEVFETAVENVKPHIEACRWCFLSGSNAS